MIERAQNFIFRGLLLNNEFEALEESGIITQQVPTIDSQERKDAAISIEDFPSKIRIDALKMSSVYMAFFVFENSVRDLIKERLSDRGGIEWWKKCVPQKIQKRVEDRRKKDEKNKWHAPRAAEDIAYTDFGDMANIIIENWTSFEDLFPNQEWVKTRLNDLEQSRNTIAHNNILEERDTQRIRMYLQDWISQVG